MSNNRKKDRLSFAQPTSSVNAQGGSFVSNPLQHRRHTWTTAGAFGVCIMLAITAEWNELHFVFGVSFSLVSLFAYLALSLFGFWRGLAAAVIPLFVGVLFLQHPYTHFIGILEIAVVGLLLRRYKARLFGSAVIFWVVIGMPLSYLVESQSMAGTGANPKLLVLILAINGLFNALFAEIFQQYLPLRKWFKLGFISRPPVSISRVLLHLTLGIVFGSFLLNITINNMSSFREVSLYANEIGKQAIGTVIKEWNYGQASMSLPTEKAEIERFQAIIDRFSYDFYTINVLDHNDNIVASNADDLIGTSLQNSGYRVCRYLFGSLSLITPAGNEHPFYLHAMQPEKFRYTTTLPDGSGSLIVEVPISNYINYLFNKYYVNFLYLIAFGILATGISLLTNRYFVRSLQHLAVSSTNMTVKLRQHTEWKMPQSNIIEIHSLMSNFRHMASSLLHLFNESQHSHNQLQAQAELLKQSEEQLHQLAFYDNLTGLPNRLKLTRRMQKLIAAQREQGVQQPIAIFAIDINRFKQVNDTLGHSKGDELLKLAAARLHLLANPACELFRLGSDEFVFASPSMNKEQLVERAQAICDMLAEPFALEGSMPIYLTASVGISVYPEDSNDAESIIRNADIAMYHAKEEGDGLFRFYVPQLVTDLEEKMRLENGLYKALRDGQFSLHYQPKMSAQSGELCGIEALIRWQHPELGMIPPDKFIPLAEKSGFILEIDRWVFHEACRQNKAWQDAGLKKIPVSVNISARHFYQGSLKEMILAGLNETGIDPQYISIEITEGVFMRNIDQVIETILFLRSLGIQISIDDFGTGYSSLNKLQLLPISDVKLDRSFIQGISRDEKKSFIVKAIIELVHSMNMKVVAEGVETADESRYCKELHCDELQGYLFSRPLPAGQFEDMLRSQPNEYIS
jgi:diguanylate cyclase (GGDEF)-like protein